VPVDAVAVAHRAATARRSVWAGRSGSRPGAGTDLRGRLVWILAAGLLVAALAGVAVIGGAGDGLVTPPASDAMTPRPTSTAACTPNDVDAVITAWQGAAGSRIATVELHNTAGFPCTMWAVSGAKLVDAGGGTLIGPGGGGSSATPTEIGATEVLHTLVEVSNYCGPAPEAPVTVVFQQNAAIFVATALSPADLTGLPPCNGENQPAVIEMQPWAR
jgi:hypothetical protein